MAQILVEFDNTLEQSEIVMPLASPGVNETAEEAKGKNKSGLKQTAVYGVMSPLIAINNSVIAFNDVIEMTLDGTGREPELHIIVRDTGGNLAHINTPGLDNELRIQIIPPFDNAYKKINLTFYISNISINDGFVTATGKYKVPDLISDKIKAFGEINTYDFFRKVAEETHLGFASNTEADDVDKHYIYCDNRNYMDLMERQIQFSGTINKVYDFWVDYWNNLNFVDMYERFNTKDSTEDMLIWISGQLQEATENVDVTATQIEPLFSNHPSQNASELYVESYNIINNGGNNVSFGTDRVASIYEKNKGEYLDHLIQNGNVKKDIFTKYTYMGEVYGDFNYMLNKIYRDAYMKNMDSEVIEIVTTNPNLAVMRGHQLKFNWYINDDSITDKIEKLEENGVIAKNSEIKTAVEVDPELTPEQKKHYNNASGEFIVDKTVSGQYLVIGTKIQYKEGSWMNTIRLTRPHSDKPMRINDGDA